MSIKKIVKWIGSVVGAILKAELLLRLRVDKYFIHIVYTFSIFILLIWLSLKIEMTMSKVEQQQRQLTELRYENSRLIFERERAGSRLEIDKKLQAYGSLVDEAQKPVIEFD